MVALNTIPCEEYAERLSNAALKVAKNGQIATMI